MPDGTADGQPADDVSDVGRWWVTPDETRAAQRQHWDGAAVVSVDM